MENKEILQKAILKAEKNGYHCELKVYSALFHCKQFCYSNNSFFAKDQNYKVENLDETDFSGIVRRWHSITNIIFSHDFAKAFWGEGHDTFHNEISLRNLIRYYFQDKDGNDIYSHLKKWQYHLQQIVLEKEPLKYLEKYL